MDRSPLEPCLIVVRGTEGELIQPVPIDVWNGDGGWLRTRDRSGV